MRRNNGSILWVCLVMALALLTPQGAWALKVGDKVQQVRVKDANDNPATIPDLGKKVLTLFYTDPDVKEQNEPFREYLKAQKLDKSKYRGLGVVNMEDTWKPDFAIRSVVRGKIEKFKSVILTDPDHILKKKWRLGECDDKDIVLIIGKDKKVYYIKKGAMSGAEKKKALQLVKDLMAK